MPGTEETVFQGHHRSLRKVNYCCNVDILAGLGIFPTFMTYLISETRLQMLGESAFFKIFAVPPHHLTAGSVPYNPMSTRLTVGLIKFKSNQLQVQGSELVLYYS